MNKLKVLINRKRLKILRNQQKLILLILQLDLSVFTGSATLFI